MAKLLHVVLVLVALCSYSLARHHHLKEAEKEDGAASRSLDQHTAPKKATAASTEESTESTEGSTEGSSSTSSNSEGKAGEAIKTLLQEKITQKFKEAANEVKGVLVKQLGDSLKSAHDVFNPPKTVDMKKAAGVTSQKVAVGKAGAAAIHQNKGPRHRKNSGPQGTPGIEGKVDAPLPQQAKGMTGLGPIPTEAKGIEGKGIGVEAKGVEAKGVEAKGEEAKVDDVEAKPDDVEAKPDDVEAKPDDVEADLLAPPVPPAATLLCTPCHVRPQPITMLDNCCNPMPPPPPPPMICAQPCQRTCAPPCQPVCCTRHKVKPMKSPRKVGKN